jgi:hypothetical protein
MNTRTSSGSSRNSGASDPAAVFRDKAARCRRLARAISDPTAAAALRALAEEFEQQAAAFDAERGGPAEDKTPPGAAPPRRS